MPDVGIAGRAAARGATNATTLVLRKILGPRDEAGRVALHRLVLQDHPDCSGPPHLQLVESTVSNDSDMRVFDAVVIVRFLPGSGRDGEAIRMQINNIAPGQAFTREWDNQKCEKVADSDRPPLAMALQFRLGRNRWQQVGFQGKTKRIRTRPWQAWRPRPW